MCSRCGLYNTSVNTVPHDRSKAVQHLPFGSICSIRRTMEMKMLHWILEAVACVAVLLRGRLWLPTLFPRRATYALCQSFFAPRPSPWPCVGCLLSFDDLAKLVSILRWSRGVAKEAELRFLAVIRSPATPHNHVRICTEQAVELCSFEVSLQMPPSLPLLRPRAALPWQW